MDFGLDGTPLNQSLTGVGHYTLELAHALARIAPEDRFELVSLLPSLGQAERESPSNLRITQVRANRLSRRFWWQVGLPRYIRRSRFRVFHGTNYSVPLVKSCPTVVTIHDLSLLLWPQTHTQHLARRARWRLPLMARRADAIIVPSQSVKTEVCEHLGIDDSTITVIPEAPRSSFWQVADTLAVRRRLNINDDFILFVGTIEPRKNLLTLVRAFEAVLRNRSCDMQLVVVGNEGWMTSELHDFLKTAAVSERVKFVGYLGDEDLRALYSSCRAFIYPSLYEGFGLPLLEAMACGAPVITSDIPSIRETVGDVAVLVSPTNVDELARGIARLLENRVEREERSVAGKQHAAKFSWEKAAAATLNVYREVSRKRTKNAS
jgi:glycosyltransferase involved in cell wall biosynthesis